MQNLVILIHFVWKQLCVIKNGLLGSGKRHQWLVTSNQLLMEALHYEKQLLENTGLRTDRWEMARSRSLGLGQPTILGTACHVGDSRHLGNSLLSWGQPAILGIARHLGDSLPSWGQPSILGTACYVGDSPPSWGILPIWGQATIMGIAYLLWDSLPTWG